MIPRLLHAEAYETLEVVRVAIDGWELRREQLRRAA